MDFFFLKSCACVIYKAIVLVVIVPELTLTKIMGYFFTFEILDQFVIVFVSSEDNISRLSQVSILYSNVDAVTSLE